MTNPLVLLQFLAYWIAFTLISITFLNHDLQRSLITGALFGAAMVIVDKLFDKLQKKHITKNKICNNKLP